MRVLSIRRHPYTHIDYMSKYIYKNKRVDLRGERALVFSFASTFSPILLLLFYIYFAYGFRIGPVYPVSVSTRLQLLLLFEKSFWTIWVIPEIIGTFGHRVNNRWQSRFSGTVSTCDFSVRHNWQRSMWSNHTVTTRRVWTLWRGFPSSFYERHRMPGLFFLINSHELLLYISFRRLKSFFTAVVAHDRVHTSGSDA